MPDVALQVIHKVPGRIRLQTPMLADPNFGWILEKLVESFEGVKGARTNFVTRSLAVEYDRHAITEADLNAKLLNAILVASDPDWIRVLESFLEYRALAVSEYEANQLAGIERWLEDQQPSGPKEMLGQILRAIAGLANFGVPPRLPQKLAATCETLAENWRAEWHHLKTHAPVEHHALLRRSEIEICDRLSDRVIAHAREKALLTGGLAFLAGIWGGMLVDVGNELEAMVLVFKTIHRIGLCYGYAPDNPHEKAFARGIFKMAIAQTETDWSEARRTLQSLRLDLEKLNPQAEVLEGALGKAGEERPIRSAIPQAAGRSAQTAAEMIALFTVYLNLWGNGGTIERITEAAKREYQLRWLLDNEKIVSAEAEI